MAQCSCPLGQSMQRLTSRQLATKLGQLLIFRDLAVAGGDRSIPVAQRDHPDLVHPGLGADLGAPRLGICSLR